MYWFSILIVIVSTVFYHSIMKSLDDKVNYFFILFLIYFTSILISSIAIFFTEGFSIKEIFSIKDKWKYILLGLSIFGVELGYIMTYKYGWKISIAPIVINVSTMLFLLFLGYLFFQETISLIQLIGIILCLIGLFFILL